MKLSEKLFVHEATIKRLLFDGKSYTEISHEIKVHIATVRRWVHTLSPELVNMAAVNSRRKEVKIKMSRPDLITPDKLRELVGYINSGHSSVKIASLLGASTYIIFKYVALYIPTYSNKLTANGREAKRCNFIDGRGVYQKYKKKACEHCGTKEHLLVHHKVPAEYDEKWEIKKGDHSPENLLTLCASCHQKEHYKLGRKMLVNKDPKTGKFLKGRKNEDQ